MSRVCQITGKKPKTGNNRSHSMRATKRDFRPNILKGKLVRNPFTGEMERMDLSAKALKSITKQYI